MHIFCNLVATPSSSSFSSPTQQRQPRLIHTSKKKVVVETKGGRSATKIKTIITSSEIKKSMPEMENSATRRSSRTKQPTNKKLESASSPFKSMTNGTQRSNKAVTQPTSSTNSKHQNNLLAELSRKSSNFNSDVVSDLEQILGPPIKTRETRNEQVSRAHTRPEPGSAKMSGGLRADYKGQPDYEMKPATRSSKRLSDRIQLTQHIDSAKSTKSNASTRNSSKRSDASPFNQDVSSEESQDEPYDNLQIENNAPANIVLNIKQEKEVSFTMTDDNSIFTCEMCSAVFSDRAQLLVHVPVHI